VEFIFNLPVISDESIKRLPGIRTADEIAFFSSVKKIHLHTLGDHSVFM
jgi:hypothetical protein